jgi:hypothetical protein
VISSYIKTMLGERKRQQKERERVEHTETDLGEDKK